MFCKEGTFIVGNTALGYTSVKFRPRRSGYHAGKGEQQNAAGTDDGQVAVGGGSSSSTAGVHLPNEGQGQAVPDLKYVPVLDESVIERTGRILELLNQCQARAPPGLPSEGRVFKENAILSFVARHRELSRLRGLDVARPQVVYHWTQERFFQSIAEQGLKVPDQVSLKVVHGSSFGVGIYTSRDFRYGKEIFSFGTTAFFVCLGLPGRQQFGRPTPDPDLLFEAGESGYDSVVGREGQRGVDELVFFRNDQLLTCFLIDQVGLDAVLETLRFVIKELHRSWAEASELPQDRVSQGLPEQAAAAAAEPPTTAADPFASSEAPTNANNRWRRAAAARASDSEPTQKVQNPQLDGQPPPNSTAEGGKPTSGLDSGPGPGPGPKVKVPEARGRRWESRSAAAQTAS